MSSPGRAFLFPLFLIALACSQGGEASPQASAPAPPGDGMAEIRGERVVLRLPPAEKSRPELSRLAADLDRSLTEMAPRVPVTLSSPVTVVVEPDYTAQGRHAGEIGEAVRGRQADLHLVYHPDDLPAYRYALAGVLLDRAGLAGKLPPELARG
ncbi:MAG TPA: hypothetical protein VII86_02375, partial [Thermoanaerobaculia bacterium]